MREKAREAMLSSAWRKRFMQALVAILLLSPIAAAQQEPAVEDQTGDLQKATQNPVASLISVPLQNNTNFGVNPGYRNQDVLNIQPVIPIGISKDWNLVVRWIAPIIYQPVPNAPGTPETGEYGLGDMVPTFFISPKKPGKLIWGVGPVFQLPTATNTYLGQGKLGIGPSIVILTQPGHWTLGVLANNVWSVAGSGSRPDVNQFLMQSFITYNLQKGWYISLAPIITANWKASRGNVWTVPFGGGIGRIMKFGAQPVSLSAQFYGNATYPAGTSPWSMRIQLAFLFPKLSKEQETKMLEKKLKQLEQEPR
jgi:hypothetical protein